MGLSVKPKQALALFSLAFATTEEERRPMKGTWLKSPDREPLVAAKLVELEKQGRREYVNLTDRGWAWVAANLNAQNSGKPQRANRVLKGVLGRLQSYLDHRGESLHAFLEMQPANDQGALRARSKPAPGRDTEPLEMRIRSTALELAQGQTRTRVRLSDIRRRLSDVDRSTLDRELLALQTKGALVLYRIDDPTDVHNEDEQAALHVAGYPRPTRSGSKRRFTNTRSRTGPDRLS